MTVKIERFAFAQRRDAIDTAHKKDTGDRHRRDHRPGPKNEEREQCGGNRPDKDGAAQGRDQLRLGAAEESVQGFFFQLGQGDVRAVAADAVVCHQEPVASLSRGSNTYLLASANRPSEKATLTNTRMIC